MADIIPWLFLIPPILVAIAAIASIVVKRTSGGKAHALLIEGGQHLHRQEHAEAEALFRKGLELKPEHPGLLGTLGSLLVSQERFEEAHALLEKANARSPKDMPIRLVLGRCQDGMGHPDKAKALWSSIPNDDPVYIDAQIFLAAACEARGELEAAIAHTESAIAQSTVHQARPYKRELKRLQGLAAKKEKKPVEAKPKAEEAEELVEG